AANPAVRRNALLLLAELFPLRDPAQGREANESLLNRQLFLLFDRLLMDPCPAVRASAAEVAGRVLCVFWEVIPSGVATSALTRMVDELAADVASPAVRMAAARAVGHLLQGNPVCHELLRGMLPRMAAGLRDRSRGVRVAVAEVLITVATNTSIRLKEVISSGQLIQALEEPNDPIVARHVTRVLLPTYLPSHLPPVAAAGRFITLMQRSLPAAAAFARCSFQEGAGLEAVIEAVRAVVDLLVIETDGGEGGEGRGEGGSKDEKEGCKEEEKDREVMYHVVLGFVQGVMWEGGGGGGGGGCGVGGKERRCKAGNRSECENSDAAAAMADTLDAPALKRLLLSARSASQRAAVLRIAALLPPVSVEELADVCREGLLRVGKQREEGNHEGINKALGEISDNLAGVRLGEVMEWMEGRREERREVEGVVVLTRAWGGLGQLVEALEVSLAAGVNGEVERRERRRKGNEGKGGGSDTIEEGEGRGGEEKEEEEEKEVEEIVLSDDEDEEDGEKGEEGEGEEEEELTGAREEEEVEELVKEEEVEEVEVEVEEFEDGETREEEGEKQVMVGEEALRRGNRRVTRSMGGSKEASRQSTESPSAAKDGTGKRGLLERVGGKGELGKRQQEKIGRGKKVSGRKRGAAGVREVYNEDAAEGSDSDQSELASEAAAPVMPPCVVAYRLEILLGQSEARAELLRMPGVPGRQLGLLRTAVDTQLAGMIDTANATSAADFGSESAERSLDDCGRTDSDAAVKDNRAADWLEGAALRVYVKLLVLMWNERQHEEEELGRRAQKQGRQADDTGCSSLGELSDHLLELISAVHAKLALISQARQTPSKSGPSKASGALALLRRQTESVREGGEGGEGGAMVWMALLSAVACCKRVLTAAGTAAGVAAATGTGQQEGNGEEVQFLQGEVHAASALLKGCLGGIEAEGEAEDGECKNEGGCGARNAVGGKDDGAEDLEEGDVGDASGKEGAGVADGLEGGICDGSSGNSAVAAQAAGVAEAAVAAGPAGRGGGWAGAGGVAKVQAMFAPLGIQVSWVDVGATDGVVGAAAADSRAQDRRDSNEGCRSAAQGGSAAAREAKNAALNAGWSLLRLKPFSSAGGADSYTVAAVAADVAKASCGFSRGAYSEYEGEYDGLEGTVSRASRILSGNVELTLLDIQQRVEIPRTEAAEAVPGRGAGAGGAEGIGTRGSDRAGAAQDEPFLQYVLLEKKPSVTGGGAAKEPQGELFGVLLRFLEGEGLEAHVYVKSKRVSCAGIIAPFAGHAAVLRIRDCPTLLGRQRRKPERPLRKPEGVKQCRSRGFPVSGRGCAKRRLQERREQGYQQEGYRQAKIPRSGAGEKEAKVVKGRVDEEGGNGRRTGTGRERHRLRKEEEEDEDDKEVVSGCGGVWKREEGEKREKEKRSALGERKRSRAPGCGERNDRVARGGRGERAVREGYGTGGREDEWESGLQLVVFSEADRQETWGEAEGREGACREATEGSCRRGTLGDDLAWDEAREYEEAELAFLLSQQESQPGGGETGRTACGDQLTCHEVARAAEGGDHMTRLTAMLTHTWAAARGVQWKVQGATAGRTGRGSRMDKIRGDEEKTEQTQEQEQGREKGRRRAVGEGQGVDRAQERAPGEEGLQMVLWGGAGRDGGGASGEVGKTEGSGRVDLSVGVSGGKSAAEGKGDREGVGGQMGERFGEGLPKERDSTVDFSPIERADRLAERVADVLHDVAADLYSAAAGLVREARRLFREEAAGRGSGGGGIESVSGRQMDERGIDTQMEEGETGRRIDEEEVEKRVHEALLLGKADLQRQFPLGCCADTHEISRLGEPGPPTLGDRVR
ncbi:unnamed protein product, partial [Closterium sp. Naga37s-1]